MKTKLYTLLLIALTAFTAAKADPADYLRNLRTGTNYSDFDAAQEQLLAGDTLLLTADHQLTKTMIIGYNTPAFVLDMNGHILDASSIATPAAAYDTANIIFNYGTLTIIDGNPTATHATGNQKIDAIAGGILTGGKGYAYYQQQGFGQQGGAINNFGTLHIKGVTFTDNNLTASYNSFGGAVASNGILTIDNTTFIDNSVKGRGAAVYADSIATIRNCTFMNDSAYMGAAVYAYVGTINLHNCEIHNERSSYGAVSNGYGTINMDSCSLHDNISLNGYGSSIYSNVGSMTVTNCEIYNDKGKYGSAYIYNATANFTNCVFRNDSCVNGALNLNKGTSTVDNCTFNGNVCEWGGGINISYANVTVTGCTFTGNRAYYAAAIYDYNGTLDITNTQIFNNIADSCGVVYNVYANVTMTGCTMNGNRSFFGGDFYQYNGTTTLSNCHFLNDTCIYGAVDMSYGTFRLDSCTINDNVGYYGAGVYNYNADLTVTGCTISGNRAAYGAGINSYYGKLDITGTQILNNIADTCGAGIYMADAKAHIGDGTVIKGNISTYDEFPNGGFYSWNMDSASITLSGTVVIDSNFVQSDDTTYAANLCLSGDTAFAPISIDSLAANSFIRVNTMIYDSLVFDHPISINGRQQQAASFRSDVRGHKVVHNADGYLEFAQAGLVTVSANVTGEGSVHGLGQYMEYDIVTLVATPAQDYTFQSWGNGETSDTLRFEVVCDTVITAAFVKTSGLEQNEASHIALFSQAMNITVTGVADRSVALYDINGRLVRSTEHADDTETFAVASAGIYFVRIDHSQTLRIVVQ